MRVLVVEDEKDLRESLVEGLRLDGYAVDSCADGAQADEQIYVETYDLIILDLNLPSMDGFTVLKNLRENDKQVNVIILSARGELSDKILGLDEGANDYMTKPFHFAELQARIRSLLRRKTVMENCLLRIDGLKYDTKARLASVDGKQIALTSKETALLEYLLHNMGRIVRLEELMEHVWDGSVDSFSNSVRVHISSLRRKLKAALGYDPVINRVGEGYMIKERKEL